MRARALAFSIGLGLILAAVGHWGCGPGDRAEVQPRTGPTVEVPAGGDLEAALASARPGDTIVLSAGATYQGPFHLPRKEGGGWISIQSSALGRLPAAGVRVAPEQASLMPKLVASSGSVIVAEAGASHYRFSGIEIAPVAGVALTNVIDFGSGSTRIEDVPHDLAIERCYVHGDAIEGSRRGLALNSAQTVVRDSYFADFKSTSVDSQAIAGWNGPGPFEITNNYLEGAGENIVFGGGDPTIPGLVPSDIVIQRNRFAKPIAWWSGAPTYAGTRWSIKNLFELKNARRVTVNGNTFDYNWPQSQNGFAILFTVRNQDGGSPWSVVEDVAFTNNIVRHVSAGINILGRDDIHTSGQTQRILIRNNLFIDVGFKWTYGRLFQLLNGADDVVVQHNTAVHSETPLFGGDTLPHQRFRFEDNIVEHNQYGIIGSGTGVGLPTLAAYFPDAIVRRNVVVGGKPEFYPEDNFFPQSLEQIGFLDIRQERYGLSAQSPFVHTATDGGNPGVDMNALLSAQTSGATVVGAKSSGLVPLLLLWASSALLVYAYVGYGAVAAAWARLRPRPSVSAPMHRRVSILVVAYNEGAQIERRLRNLRALDYPAEQVEIVVASDGSTDDTIARATGFTGVRVVRFRERRGKAAVLNDVVPTLSGELVVFADARQSFDPQVLTALTARFADPSVGAVSGQLVLVADEAAEAAGTGSALYWDFEKRIRWWESQVDSSVGVTGAIYAIRRRLFEPLKPETLLDDVVIPMRIARRGWRVVFEPTAVAVDRVTATARQEFTRKVRTIAGTFQLLALEPWMVSPVHNRLWFQTVSHKFVRLFVPVLYVVILVSTASLTAIPFYRWVLAGQIVFYTAAAAGRVWPVSAAGARLFVIPYTICFLSWATVVGFVRYITRTQRAAWERSPPAVRH